MTWGIDLDEVIFNFVDPYFVFLSKKYGRKIVRTDLIDDWSAEGCGLVPQGTGEENILEFGNQGGFVFLDLMPGAKDGLFSLSNKHSIVFITARPKEFRADTIYTLKRIGYGDIPLYFADHTSTKGMIIADLHIDYLIDDNPYYINDARRFAPQCITIMMSTIPGAIKQAHPHELVSGWDELKEKRPELK